MAVATARWLLLLLLAVSAAAAASSGKKQHERWRMSGAVGGQLVEKERRRAVAQSEAGSVTAVDVADAAGTAYRLHFITMDPGALFLPVQLHADMVFYVHSGRGKVTFIEESSEQSSLEVGRGDVYNFEQGSILYIQSYPNATRQRLRIYAIFTSEAINADDPSKPKVEAYSSVSNLVKGFETDVLRLGFGVKPEVVEVIKSAKTPPQIIPYNPEEKRADKPNWTEDIVDALLGVRDPEDFLNKKKKDKHKRKDKDKKSKSKAFNFYSGKPDVKNCYGWSRTMTNKDLDALHGSNVGMFMVNLTTGSMMGPHWNPEATEIAIVTDGSGVVQTVCPSTTPSGESSRRGHHHHAQRGEPGGRGDEGEGGGARWQCRNSVFRVKEGDVFVVPQFHPMAQMSFNNDSFVFVGFSTHMGQNHPQFLAGKGSVLHAIGNKVLALGQHNSTAVDKLLSAQRDSTILSCISCAEELEEKAAKEDEERREREEKERKEREEEEKRKREEEEKREREEERKEREEEEKREREKEREREEEERKKREEDRKKEEEERARKEQEKQRRKEEEKARREQEEEERAKEEKRQREEEEREREEEDGGGGRGDEPKREEGGD